MNLIETLERIERDIAQASYPAGIDWLLKRDREQIAALLREAREMRESLNLASCGTTDGKCKSTSMMCLSCQKEDLARRFDALTARNAELVAEVEELRRHHAAEMLGHADAEREVARLTAENAKLREVVERLPKTADGVPMYPEMKVWVVTCFSADGSGKICDSPRYVHEAVINCIHTRMMEGEPKGREVILDVSKGLGGFFPESDIYSTEAAALAHGKEGQQDYSLRVSAQVSQMYGERRSAVGYAWAKSIDELKHVCGASGFGTAGDVCPRCELDRAAIADANRKIEEGQHENA